ncbi:MAG: OB-fold domain-containing protein [Thermoplasmata archaeon]|nr:OB-fold domain-containing protein [Thermoplasmata archaeon]
MSDPVTTVPHSIADYYQGIEQENRLRGYRSACGFVTATWGLVCPQCGRRDLAEVDLSGRGKVVGFTIQNVPSDRFVNDAPYAYVVVELDEGGRVTGWMPSARAEGSVSIGDRVRRVATGRPGVAFERELGPPTSG